MAKRGAGNVVDSHIFQILLEFTYCKAWVTVRDKGVRPSMFRIDSSHVTYYMLGGDPVWLADYRKMIVKALDKCGRIHDRCNISTMSH